MTRALVYDEHGTPGRVLTLRDLPLPEMGPDEVLVRWIAAPVNPADLNMIEGETAHHLLPEFFVFFFFLMLFFNIFERSYHIPFCCFVYGGGREGSMRVGFYEP